MLPSLLTFQSRPEQGCKVRGEAGADPQPREPHKHSAVRKGCPPSALPAAQAVGPGAALLTCCVPLPHPTAHASHPLPLGPASHSAIHTQASTVPSPPGFSQTHLGLVPAARLCQPTWPLWPPCPTWTMQVPPPSPAPSLTDEIRHGEVGSDSSQLHPALSSSGGVWSGGGGLAPGL